MLDTLKGKWICKVEGISRDYVPMQQVETRIPRQRSLSSWNLNSICWTAPVNPTKAAIYRAWMEITGMIHWVFMWQRWFRGFFMWRTTYIPDSQFIIQQWLKTELQRTKRKKKNSKNQDEFSRFITSKTNHIFWQSARGYNHISVNKRK